MEEQRAICRAMCALEKVKVQVQIAALSAKLPLWARARRWCTCTGGRAFAFDSWTCRRRGGGGGAVQCKCILWFYCMPCLYLYAFFVHLFGCRIKVTRDISEENWQCAVVSSRGGGSNMIHIT